MQLNFDMAAMEIIPYINTKLTLFALHCTVHICKLVTMLKFTSNVFIPINTIAGYITG